MEVAGPIEPVLPLKPVTSRQGVVFPAADGVTMNVSSGGPSTLSRWMVRAAFENVNAI